MYPPAAGRQEEQAKRMICHWLLRKKNGKVPLAQFAWSIHMMLFSYCVLLTTRAADHICVVPTTITRTALNTLKKLTPRRNWPVVFCLSLHLAFHYPLIHNHRASSHV
uniref:Uncharacterized protein n=1 Tax=Arundo donax TaxID=35708 RepID=A0A0A8XTU8_ARUDO